MHQHMKRQDKARQDKSSSRTKKYGINILPLAFKSYYKEFFMFIENLEIFAYYDDGGNLLCPECASTELDLNTIGSAQVLTRDEADRNEGFYFCDVHPSEEDNQIV